MSGTRCQRCGTLVPAGRVICPRCDNVVDLSFLGEATRAELDDDDASSPFDTPTLTLTTTTTRRTTTTSNEPEAPDGVVPGPVLDLDIDALDPELITLTASRPADPAKPPAPAPARREALTTPQRPRAQLTTPEPLSLSSLSSEPPADAPSSRSTFLEETTDADLSELSALLRSSTDALVLGDAGDIVESLWVEQSLTSPELEQLALVHHPDDSPPPMTAPVHPADDNGEFARSRFGEVRVNKSPTPDEGGFGDFLTAPTVEGLRDIVPVQVYIGADVARLIEKDAVLERAPTVGPVMVSTFEQYVLDQIDGVRPVARIQKRMGLTDGDLRIALALLVDKKLVQRRGRATAVVAAGSTAPVAVTGVGGGGGVGVNMATPGIDLELVPIDGPGDEDVTAPVPGKETRSPALTSELPSVPRPALRQGPVAPGVAVTGLAPALPRATTPAPFDPASAPPLRAGLVVDDAGRSRAATLHAQCLRDLKNGAVARAYGLARMAHDAAPDVANYREIVEDWNAFVAAHKTADDARLHAQAVNAETLGDAARAVSLLKQAAQANPNNAAVWNRLGLLLATRMKDIDGALEAMTRAIELSPDDATFKNNFGKIAALAERRGGPSVAKGGIFQKLFRK